jgi:hypothetical protein
MHARALLILLLSLALACGDKDDTGTLEDADRDGYGAAVDCDDADANVHPGGLEQPYNGVDDDCDSSTPDDDLDDDGYLEAEDCDDGDPDAHPGGVEVCDGTDNDCDNQVDEGALDTLAWYADEDGDGFGDPDSMVLDCERPPGHVADDSDCDDSDPEVFPGAEEPWDGVDNDCDGEVDEEGGAPLYEWYHDGDGDGYGDLYDMVEEEKQPYGYVPNHEDCDDTDGEIFPGADERCNELDDDCDRQIDEDGACLELDPGSEDDRWIGDDYGDEAGWALDGGVDLTGDGTDDFIIGAPSSSTGGQFYVMPGEFLGWYSGLALDAASSSGAITWSTAMPGAELGADVALFPDVDGDGEADFGVGAPGADGAGLIVVWLSSLDDYTYLSLSGGLNELGEVASAGDVNRDGNFDLLIGGTGYTVEGGDEGFVELYLGDDSEQLVPGGYWYGQEANDELGSELASAGDLDGDGFADLLLGAQGYPGGDRSGAVWLVLGVGFWPGAQIHLDDADHVFVGGAAGDHAGRSLSGEEDFDGDGYDDFVMGAPYRDAAGSVEGEVYLWTGGTSWASTGGSWSTSSAPVSFRGEGASSRAGWSVQLLRDFDGDRNADLAVGSPYLTSSSALRGKVYLLRGGGGHWSGACDLADADYSWLGEQPGDHLGWSLAAGDADDDGLGDLLIGAPGSDDAGSNGGEVYLILGW